jgi:anti-anti-sigma factor
MGPVEVSPDSVWHRPPALLSRCDADHRVIWLRGAHDASTAAALCMTVARTIAVDDADLIIDLSEVTFMDAATVGVIIRAEAFLQERSRSLTLRSPSTPALRILSAGGLADLVDPGVTSAPGCR